MISFKVHILLKEILKSEGTCDIKELSEKLGIDATIIKNIVLNFKSLSIKENKIFAVDITSLVIEAWIKGYNVIELALSTGWRNVEKLCEVILSRHGYRTLLNYRFKHSGKRYEIDVVGIQEPYILLIDCKRWKRGNVASLIHAAEAQVKRTQEFVYALQHSRENVNILNKSINDLTLIIIPLIVTVLDVDIKFHEGVPIVPIRYLRDFLTSFKDYEENFVKFTLKL